MLRWNPQSPPARKRRGAILLVVLALLALFAVIGLSFVLYAESEANAARVHRQAQDLPADGLPPDPQPSAENVLKQILYGDPENDRSALYGHSLAAIKYGGQGGTTPYNGVGTIAAPLNGFPAASGIATLSREQVLRYGRFGNGANSEFVIDPEHVFAGNVVRTDSGTYPNNLYYDNGSGGKGNPKPANDPSLAPLSPIYVPKNAPYTYPDRNNALLALVTPPEPSALPAVTDAQQVVAISGHRASLFGSLSSPTLPGFPVGALATGETVPNNNWLTPEGGQKILRPRPKDHVYNGTSEFPYPPANADGSITGDVQTYRFQSGQQRNDSLWMYPGLPVTRYKGKNITALVAPMLLPLDGRVNLNAAGNALAAGGAHGSHSGFGPHEIALWRVLQSASVNATQAQILASQVVSQRYNSSIVPNPAELPNVTTATTLANAAPTGLRYPAYPTPSTVPTGGGFGSPFAVKAFHPAPTPFSINPPTGGPTSILQANQFLPPIGSQVNYGTTPQYYFLPGDPTAPTFVPGNSYGTLPNYTNWALANSNSTFVPADAATMTGAQGDTVHHPLTWNPLRRGAFERGVTPGVGVYPITDLRYTAARYSMSATDIQNNTFVGDTTRPFNMAPTLFSDSGPTAPASANNVNRALTTPISNSQQAAMLSPNFFDSTGRTLSLTPVAPGAPQFPPTLGATRPTFSVTAAGGPAGSDTFDGSGSNQQLANRLARLGPVDLNRPLADYPTAPDLLVPTRQKLTAVVPADPQFANYVQQVFRADNDRQQLAMDIFIRLAAATGGAIVYDPTSQRFVVDPSLNPDPAIADARYAALRWLAQYAANIVDAIDGDDVNFAFVWNPLPPTPPATYDPRAATNFSSAALLQQRVVFGVEKPRVVINEAYAELTNDPTEAMTMPNMGAMKPFQARFFVELLNASPISNPALPATDPSSQSIQPQNVALAHNLGGTYQEVYRIEVLDNSQQVKQLLSSPANVAGIVQDSQLAATLRRRIQMPLTNMAIASGVNDTANSPVNDPAHTLEPNGGAYAGSNMTNQRVGFALVGPGNIAGAGTKIDDDGTAYIPDVTGMGATDFSKMMIQKPLAAAPPMVNPAKVENQMAYYLTECTNTDLKRQNGTEIVRQLSNSGMPVTINRHSVLLQRLANPYLPVNDPNNTTVPYNTALPANPYITVDVMHDVALFDAVRIAKKDGSTGDRMMDAPKKEMHQSIGRTQPYAGYAPLAVGSLATPTAPVAAPDPYSNTTAWVNSPTNNGNLTLRQKLTTTGMPPPVGLIQQSFMTQNGSLDFIPATPTPTDRNLQYPFAWMPHFDRLMVNQEELLHVAVCKPHELTAKFATPGQDSMVAPPDSTALTNRHTLNRYFDPTMLGDDPAQTRGFGYDNYGIASPLYRALEMLQTKSFVHDTPVGGRVAGKVNVNMIWDRKVFDALIDQNGGSRFNAAQVDQMWTDFITSRTPTYPAVAATVDETAAGGTTDRPFKAFGAPAFAAGGSRFNDSGVADTLMRVIPATLPHQLFSAYQTPGSTLQAHPYFRNEPLRKILNNVTTTTDTFLLIYTISFFEVRNPLAAGEHYYDGKDGVPVVLGKEVFKEVPGDLRAQFVAVLDRSNLTLPESPAVDPGIPGLPADPPVPLVPLNPSPERGLWVIETASELGTNPLSVQVNLYSEPTLPISPAIPAAGTPNFGPNELISNPIATGSYATRDDDRDPSRNFTIAGGAAGVAGTRFAIGTGRQRIVLEALGSNNTNPWTYDPLSGRTRIPVQLVSTAGAVAEEVSDPLANSYPAGTMLSNVRFGSRIQLTPTPGVTNRSYGLPSFDPKTPSPQVPLFGRLPSP